MPVSARLRALRPLSRRAAALLLAAALGALAPASRAAGALSQAGGNLGDVVVSGHVAYLAQGTSITVWQLDAAGVAAPARVFTTPPLPGLVSGLAVGGAWLYATWASDTLDGALVVYSLADPLAPAQALELDYAGSSFTRPGGLALVGTHLLMTDTEAGLHSIDVANPLAPSLVATAGSFGLQRVALQGNHLIAWGRSFLGSLFLETFLVANPANPLSVGFYSSGNYLDAAVADSLAVLVGDGIEVVDLSNPANPTWQATVSGPTGRTALFDGRYAYVGDEAGVHVWDLADPEAPVEGTLLVAPADRAARAAFHTAATGSEGLLLTENGRALVLGLTNPAQPTLAHTVDLPVGIDPTVAVEAGGHLYVADFYSGLRVMETDLDDLGRLDPGIFQGAYEDFTVAGTTGYLSSWGYGLLTIDLTDPTAPARLGGVPFGYASAVDVAGGYAYLTKSTSGGALAVVDVSDPANPTIAGSAPLAKGLDVLYHSGLVLVADEAAFDTGGLRIFDVSAPASPTQLGHYTACSSAGGVDARGTIAALACHDGTLHVVDLTNPAAPVQVGVWEDDTRFLTGHRARFDGRLLWFGHSDGLELLDLADPAQPRRVATLDLPWAVRGLELSTDGAVWAAAGIGGLYRVDLLAFADDFESGDTDAWSATVPAP